MDTIELIEPNESYSDDLWAFRAEVMNKDRYNKDMFAGCKTLQLASTPQEFIDIIRLRTSEETCRKAGTGIPSNTYLAVRKEDNRIVGIIDLRHHINHPILSTWGGHTDFTVRPSERRKGYATRMLALNIEKAKERKIDALLVTCSIDNEASEKIIIRNGGVYEKEVEVDDDLLKRYWITL